MKEYFSIGVKIIEFLHKRYGGSEVPPTLFLDDSPKKYNQLGEGGYHITIFIYSFQKRNLTLRRFVEAICHEYRHVYQNANGYFAEEDWKGMKYDGDISKPGPEYLNAPWEKDARRYEKIYFKELVKAKIIDPSKLNKRIKI